VAGVNCTYENESGSAFEMGYHDQKRMRRFYETVFGWQTKELGPEMGHLRHGYYNGS